jgi:hypothetical protein
MAFSATPEAVTAALRKSPKQCIQEAFVPGAVMPKSEALAGFEGTIHQRYREAKKKNVAGETLRELRRVLRQAAERPR